MVAPRLTPALDSLGQARQAPVKLVARKSCQLAPISSKQCLITLRTEKKALPSIASPPPPLLGPQDFCAPLFVPGPSFSRRKGHHNPIHLSLVPHSLVEGTDKHPSKCAGKAQRHPSPEAPSDLFSHAKSLGDYISSLFLGPGTSNLRGRAAKLA